MPVTYRYVYTNFWEDPFIQDISPEDKYFYLYVITNPHTNQCGIYEITPKTMAFETGYNNDTIHKLLKRFAEYKRVFYNEECSELFIVKWLKYNGTKSPKIADRLNEELVKVKTLEFKNSAIKLCLELGYPIDTLSIGYQEVDINKTEAKRYGIDTLSIGDRDVNIDIDIDKDLDTDKEVDTLSKIKKTEKLKFGEYQNVLLTKDEYERLKIEIDGSLEPLINKMSEYLKAHGKTYKDYSAALKNWARRDINASENRLQSGNSSGPGQPKAVDYRAGLGGPGAVIHRPA